MNYFTVLQYIIIDLSVSLIYWPIWWYSIGLVQVFKITLNLIVYYYHSLAVNIWLKNIFVPMFGQTDWQSRLISFIVRLGNVFARSAMLVIWTIFCLLIPLVYMLILPLSFAWLLYNLLNLNYVS
jgi:hypothetical protein